MPFSLSKEFGLLREGKPSGIGDPFAHRRGMGSVVARLFITYSLWSEVKPASRMRAWMYGAEWV